MQNREQKKADQDQTTNSGNQAVDQHRDLEIERFLAMRVDLGGVRAFREPDDEWAKDVSDTGDKKSGQCTGMAENRPGSRVG